jgi:RNA polymerase sigma-70 factor, ECF subfamily
MSTFASDVLEHLPRLKRYARSLRRDLGQSDDLVQETIMRALENAHLYRHDTYLCGWLVTIMHNLHVNGVRSQSRGPTFVSDEIIGTLGRAPTQEAPVELHEIRRAVARLPPAQREPLLLHWLYGFKYEEVAKKMGIPHGTVQSRISRARKTLRTMLDEPNSGLGLAHRTARYDRASPDRRLAASR